MIVAVQKNGKLSEDSLEFLKKHGFNIKRANNSRKHHIISKEDIIILVRYGDIVNLVKYGVVDCGIVGTDFLIESLRSGSSPLKYKELDFGYCRISLIVSKNSSFKKIKDFEEKTVVTELPRITKKFFNNKGVNVKVVKVKGSTEVFSFLGFADAIVDIVSTGSSIRTYNLKEFQKILDIQALLVYKSSRKVGGLISKINY
ncbi:MAG: ATP phosphoribosyltransferase [Candidatus Woesebacteria bacterium GW2011_GWB1_39_10b]|uniref:ATP phosphoribosyltransferase n=2 Tax=Candidatus Woeseibacteriota TaxID=1752722 RepID=A0A0G0P5A1_9BACT|nr:MAG: ATP phosphoribosyltransferase [Candidatus Woesebacteria bacterium GW2011_GWB1_39_10b]OGM62308.1 MAG: ATP phosphoribosyltransferase [Candidatus Woesebacteria bacterium RIFCSPLOWO2_01_FULL_39_14]